MILITGASGSVGKAVLQEAIRKASKVRAMYRSKEEAAKAPSGCEARLADYADKQSLSKALDGVTSVFVVCSPIPQLVELESNVVDVCKESGVKHVVLNSALGAGDYPKSFPGWHRKVEDKLKATAMSCTILRPNGFLQNIVTYNAPASGHKGRFTLPWETRKSAIWTLVTLPLSPSKRFREARTPGRPMSCMGRRRYRTKSWRSEFPESRGVR